ncbi:MAG: hypothetical protein WCP08_04150 [Prolixibacteraceae bacterium]
MGKGSFRYFAAAIVLFSVLASCNKSVEVSTEVFTDSYIHSVFNTKDTVESKRYPVYSVMHSAFSYSKLGSVKVSGSSGSMVTLKDFGGTGFSFYTPVDTSIYKSTVPAAENFIYNVVYSSGEAKAQTETILAKSLAPARNLNAVKTSTDIQVTWKPVTNAEAYKIRVQSENLTTKALTLIYESDFLVPLDLTASLSLSFPIVNFLQILDTNLYFEISAFVFQQNHETYQAVSETTIKRYYGN